jgi:1,4-alpha-glucan branching enzyme
LVFVVPYGVDVKFFERPETPRSGLLYAGSWLYRKGVYDLAKAYRVLYDWGLEIPLTVVGFGTPREFVLGDFDPVVRNRITAVESMRLVDEETMIQEYGRHDLLAFPSRYEGFGMVFLEGMASGLAVVATPVGGAVDVIQDGANGCIIPVGDPLALATSIAKLWRSPDRGRHLGLAARTTAKQLTWDRIASKTLACYRAIADEANSKAAG